MSLSDQIFTDDKTAPGLFCKLLSEASSAAAGEARLQNITTSEYAKLWLGLVGNAMSISAQLAIQGAKVDEEVELLKAQTDKVRAEIELLNKQKELADKSIEKADQDILLSKAKVVTEEAQTKQGSVDLNSVIGRQKALYQAQTKGYARDAEQKAAKMLIDTWNVRRTTDDETQATNTNQLTDTFIGQAVAAMLAGATSSDDDRITGFGDPDDIGGDFEEEP